ncbi:MAG: bifunctional 2',3'-cyclic-nucleotide 2'-phosphodiesterase/3'-nucleotidase [Gammaproteobacteria bacterium]|nr:bifunctional 2',3'-cyclic-nucleotide 2'-phosphodiesterase/3'-nucleotidase [Gammaproteobacteria bacterium]MDH3414838.1 bifunctional 2',3'-cyclic-nucleotide 2'-phosphodiesterase/3'-nucleotidase [Gammaproteobacteria bacterium]
MTTRPILPAAFVLAALLASANLLADANVQLRVLETTDIHVHIVDYDYYQDQPSVAVGLARTATLIEIARAEVKNSILVDNGDLLQGNPLGDFIARQRGLGEGDVHPVYKAMNLLDYTVGNVGNHEFNFGLEFLGQSIAGANFNYISANVFYDDGDDDASNDEPYFDQYIIVDRTLTAEDGSEHDIKIGIIGFVPPQIMNWDMANLKGRVVAHDIVDTARELVPRMKAEGADVVIAVPHSGIGTVDRHGMDENATYYLSQVPDINAIMFGHTHGIFPSDEYAELPGIDIEKGTINGVPATMPGYWGNHLGYVDLQLSVSGVGEWTVTSGIGTVRPIFRRDGNELIPLVEPMQEILTAVQEDHDATIAFVRTGVGELSAAINSFFALVRDDPSVQIVTNAQKRYVERLIQGTEFEGTPVLSASAPFKSGGRGGDDNFTDIDAGEIALKHVADLYIYPNTLRAVKITGSQVREWLEMSASIFNRIDPNDDREQELLNPGFLSFNFDVIDGVSYRIDVTQAARYDRDGKLINAASHRILDLSYDGQPIDMDEIFIVATNNYRAGGGGHFPGMDGGNIIIEAPDTNRSVLADYIFELQTVDPSADNNWSFMPIAGDVKVTFTSSSKAGKALTPDSPIEQIGINDDGSGKYRIRF